MLEVYERMGTVNGFDPDLKVILSHEQRDRGRLRVFSTDGQEVRLFLERGKPLEVGEMLRSRCGRSILVEGAIEPLMIASCEDLETFAKACYHLGNRHVKVQVGKLSLRLQPDHVLEEMLLLLGMSVQYSNHVFVPEPGAYSGQARHGGHAHEHAHDHH